jgi:hypothetical protein
MMLPSSAFSATRRLHAPPLARRGQRPSQGALAAVRRGRRLPSFMPPSLCHHLCLCSGWMHHKTLLRCALSCRHAHVLLPLCTGGAPDRGLPRPLVRRVLLALALQENWGGVGWASDWGANIFAPRAFLGGARDPPREHVVRTQFTAPDGSAVDKTWRVTTKWAAVHDLGALAEYAAGRLVEEEVPRSALQVLEVVLRSGVSGA